MNILLAILCATIIAQSDPGRVEFRADGQSIEAVLGGRVIWKNSYHLADDEDAEQGALVGPVHSGDFVYYAVGISLYRVDPPTGRIERRYYLPDSATAIRAGSNEAVGGVSYDIEVEIVSHGVEKNDWSRTYRVGGDYGEVPFYLSGNLRNVNLLERDAKRAGFAGAATGVVETINRAESPDDLDTAARTTLQIAVQKLQTEISRDSTNPWYYYYLGHYYGLLGDASAERQAFSDIFSLDSRYDIELLRLALKLDDIDPELGDLAFERGFHFLLGHAYEPELMKSLLLLMLYYGHPTGIDKPQPDIATERLETLGNRIWRLAPFVEGVTYFYQGISDRYHKDGDEDAAQIWHERARQALPYRFFGLSGKYIDFGVYAFDYFLALLLASVAMIVLKFIRVAPALYENVRSGSGLSRKLPFSVWSRGEIVGLLLAAGLMTYLLWLNATSILAIGVTAAMPHGILAGNFGHPDAVQYFDECAETEQCLFIKALSLQQSASTLRSAICGGSAADIAARDTGEQNRCAAALAGTDYAKNIRRAEEIYRQLDLPQARVNLGIIEQERGNSELAQQLYRKAQQHQQPPPAASFNLGLAADSRRLQEAAQEKRLPPLPALPTDAIYFSAVLEKGADHRLWTRLVATTELLDDSLPFSISPKAWYLVVLAAITALLSLFIRPKNLPPSKRSTVGVAGWLLGWIVPGSARQLGPIGPLYLGLFFLALMSAYIQSRSDGYAVGIIEVIAVPNFAKYFGAYGSILSEASATMVALAHYWWVLLLANPVLVLIAEKIKPDPEGLMAATATKGKETSDIDRLG